MEWKSVGGEESGGYSIAYDLANHSPVFPLPPLSLSSFSNPESGGSRG